MGLASAPGLSQFILHFISLLPSFLYKRVPEVSKVKESECRLL